MDNSSDALRTAVPDDVGALHRIAQDSFGHSAWSIDTFTALLEMAQQPRAEQLVLVRESYATVRGYVVARIAADEAEIQSLGVHPQFRRQGIGRQLVAACLEQCHARRVANVYLEVRASNHTAHLFYETCGFTACGTRKRYYSDPVEDALLMALQLE